jgi:Flp pilus assembly pilin Flp
VEYALLVALIAAVIIVIVAVLGSTVAGGFQSFVDQL